MEMLVDNDLTVNVKAGHDTQDVTQTVPSADLPSTQEPEPPDTLPRSSERERKLREILTYDSLGQPTHRVVGPHTNSMYVNTLAPVYGQCSVPWLPPHMFGKHLISPTFVSVGYYKKTVMGCGNFIFVKYGHMNMGCL